MPHGAFRRCASLEIAPPEDLTDEEVDRLQIAIDRARSAAQRTFHRSLKELRRLQTENLHPAEVIIKQAMAMDTLLKKDLEQRERQLAENREQSANAVHAPSCAIQETRFAKQTQSESTKSASVPRSAPCPCKSGQKYKRCCGKNAAPVLTTKAA